MTRQSKDNLPPHPFTLQPSVAYQRWEKPAFRTQPSQPFGLNHTSLSHSAVLTQPSSLSDPVIPAFLTQPSQPFSLRHPSRSHSAIPAFLTQFFLLLFFLANIHLTQSSIFSNSALQSSFHSSWPTIKWLILSSFQLLILFFLVIPHLTQPFILLWLSSLPFLHNQSKSYSVLSFFLTQPSLLFCLIPPILTDSILWPLSYFLTHPNLSYFAISALIISHHKLAGLVFLFFLLNLFTRVAIQSFLPSPAHLIDPLLL